jgi:transposase
MLSLSTHTKVYLAREPLDMRRQIDGLALEVQEVLQLNPMSAHIFIFRNQRGDRLKGLYWDGNGFLMIYKRIERGRFQWPDIAGQSVALGLRELQWLLEGRSLEVLRPSAAVAACAV